MKRRLRRTNVLFPESTHRLINESDELSVSISGADVPWINWKDFLRNKFVLLKEFKISHTTTFVSAAIGGTHYLHGSILPVMTEIDSRLSNPKDILLIIRKF